MAKFRAKKFEPEAYTLYSYAAVQIIKQAAEAAKSLDPKKVAEKMHSGMKFKTVIGDISYDKKGDITRLDYVMYVWKKNADGKITYVECPAAIAARRSKPRSTDNAKSPPSPAGFFLCALGVELADLAQRRKRLQQPDARPG